MPDRDIALSATDVKKLMDRGLISFPLVRQHAVEPLRGKSGRPRAQRVRTCRVCGCTEADCSRCIARTGQPCSWVPGERDLCSACLTPYDAAAVPVRRKDVVLDPYAVPRPPL